uniref:PH domain-containing protein n=1 Tax=Bursaphelenchus xylophilus TaxID=6326 RepID=A0A1I7SE77_BURXY
MVDEISLSGIAYKYTNFWFGYQKRFFKLRKGTIYYYLSKENERDGCRKFRVLKNFRLEFDDDPNRLDICFPDERWALRFCSVDEQNLWRDALDAFLQPQNSSKILSTERWAAMNRDLGPESSEKPDSNLITRTDYLSEPTYSFTPHRSVDLDLHRLEHMKESLPQQFSLVHEVLSKIVETRAAPLDLAIVEQSVDRCKQIAESMRYLQSVLPQIQVSMAEDAFEALSWPTTSEQVIKTAKKKNFGEFSGFPNRGIC